MATGGEGTILRTPKKKSTKNASVSPATTRAAKSRVSVPHSSMQKLASEEPVGSTPTHWSDVFEYVKCARHSEYLVNRILHGETVLSWEWARNGLCLYIYSDNLDVPASVRHTGVKTYAATTRTYMSKPDDGSHLGDSSCIIVKDGMLTNGREPVDPQAYEGYTLIASSKFYIITGGKKGEPLPTIRAEPPLSSNVECAFCEEIIQEDPEHDNDDDGLHERSHGSVVSIGAGQWIRQVPYPAMVGTPVITEKEDYWGTKYDLITYANWSFLQCRDTSVYSLHTTTGPGYKEIYPDVATKLDSIRLATASRTNPCYYTDDGTGRCFSVAGRQTFMLIRNAALIVANCDVIKSKNRLMSGQCVYYWVSGWSPYGKNNVRVGSVITFGRKIGQHYYYAISNGSCRYSEYKLAYAGRIKNVEYVRNRAVCTASPVVVAVEHQTFKNNTMFRLLSEQGRVISSWTDSTDVVYNPWELEYFGMPARHFDGIVRGMKQNLETFISDNGGWILALRKIEDELANLISSNLRVEATSFPAVAFGTSETLALNSVTVRLIRGGDCIVRELGGGLMVRGSIDYIASSSSIINAYLWGKGFPCITWTGDLEQLLSFNRSQVQDFFSGSEVCESPLVIFSCRSVANITELKSKFVSECPTFAGAIVKLEDTKINSDWKPGSAKLRSDCLSKNTLESLKAWRAVVPTRPEELIYDMNRASVEACGPEEICDLGPGDWWAGDVMSALDSGTCFGKGSNLITSHHVTYGNNVTVTRAGLTYTWDKVFYDSPEQDLIVYGDRAYQFAVAQKGEILCVTCPTKGVGKFLIVERTNSEVVDRADAVFYEMRPVEVGEDYNYIRPSSWAGLQGMSGSPIVNSNGDVVSVYGLGKMEAKSISSHQKGAQSEVKMALTVLAPEASCEMTPVLFFKSVVTEMLGTQLDDKYDYYLVEAPTGSGKTIHFTSQLLMAIEGRRRVYLLQPTVAAVKGSFEHLSKVLDVTESNKNRFCLEYVVGQQHADHSDIRGSGPTKLIIMSYGSAIKRRDEILSEADYVLLDEVHCRADPTVVAGDLQFTLREARYKCVHLTATVLSRTRAKQLGRDIALSSTRYAISEHYRIEPVTRGESSTSGYWVIPPKTIATRIEGFPDGYKIPLEPIKEGRVVFFLSTRNDCERLCSYARKTAGDSREYITIHGGTTYNPESLAQDCWCFCTDVVGQAVTIPGCVAVVDFFEEMKPDTRLDFDGDSLAYEYRLVRRTVGVATSKQRKGRTGRTNKGFYLRPAGLEPAPDYAVDKRTAAVVLLELEANNRLDWGIIERHHNLELVSMLKEIEWLLPRNLATSNWWRDSLKYMDSSNLVYKHCGKSSISGSLSQKLSVIKDVSGDVLYLYLSPVVSDELVLATATKAERLRLGSLSDDEVWHKLYFNFVWKTKTEEDRRLVLDMCNSHISSFLEDVSGTDRVEVSLLSKLKSGLVSEKVGNDAYVYDSAAGIIGGTAVAIGASAVLVSSIYHLTLKNIDRFVTRVFPLRNKFVSGHCKYLVAEYDKAPESRNHAKLIGGKALDILTERKEAIYSMLARAGWPVSKERTHSIPAFASILSGAQSMLMSYWVAIPAAYHIGAFPSLAVVMGATWMGSTFSSLERVVGRAIATAILGILNGMTMYFTTAPLAVVSCVAQVIGFVMRGITSGAVADYDVYGRQIGSSDRAWDLVFGIGAGAGIAYLLKNQLLVTAQAASAGVLTTTADYALGVTRSSSTLLGTTGNAIIFVKQVYLILTRVQDGNLPWNSLGAAITACLQVANMDISTACLGVLTCVALMAVRTGLKAAKYQAGISCKSTRPADGTNAYVEEFFGEFDSFAMTVLSTASCLASPSSLISVVIAWIGNCCRRGETNRRCFTDAFEAYAGVPVAVAIISEGVTALGRAESGERHSLDLFTLALGIPSFIAGVFGCMYWARNPVVVHALSDVWENVKGFFSFACRFVKDGFNRIVHGLGKTIGSGIVGGVLSKLPAWCQPSSSDIVLEERFSMVKSEPSLVNEWFYRRVLESRVSIIERIHYSRPINKYEHYGNVPPKSFVDFSKRSSQGLSICRRYHSAVPFDFFCLTAEDLKMVLSCFCTNVHLDGQTMSLSRGDCHVSVELSYNANVAAHFVRVSKGVIGISFLIVSVKKDEGSINYVLGYRAPKAMLDMLFSKLACLHPAIEALSGTYEDVEPHAVALDTNHLCGWSNLGVEFQWQRMLTGVCISVADRAATVFGLISKVKENQFDAGLIPESWCDKPESLSLDEWQLYQWLLWAHYESGTMITSGVDRLSIKQHLPARLLSCCVNLWRVVPGTDHLNDCSKKMLKYSGGVLHMKRSTDITDPGFRRKGGDFFASFNLSNGLDGIDSWAHSSWWGGLNVFYSFNDVTQLCTLGGYCSCSVVILVGEACRIGVLPCPTHASSWTFSHSETAEVGDNNNFRVERDDELACRLNKVLDQWYGANPWRRTLSETSNGEVIDETVQTRSWLASVRRLWSATETVEHSESIVQDVVQSVQRLYDALYTKGESKKARCLSALEDWNVAAVTSQISKKRRILDEVLETQLAQTPIETSEEVSTMLYSHLMGYHEPNIGTTHGWKWLGVSVHDLRMGDTSVSDVIRAGKDCARMLERIGHVKKQRYENLTRVQLPPRSGEGDVYVSRGGYKMQQLHEADPAFFEDTKVILDCCCGYGGFAEYYSSALSDKSPKTYVMSTLFEKGHRIPVGEIRQTAHSNVSVVLVTSPEDGDKGNIKDSRCLARLISRTKSFGGHDLLIIDAGEYSVSGDKNRSFWLSKTTKGSSFLSAVLSLIEAMDSGSKCCIKINGLWHGLEQVIHELTHRFAKVKAIKLGTTTLANPEWYLLCSNYGARSVDVRRASCLVSTICDEQRYHYLLMQQVIRVRGRGYKVQKRGDWFSPGRMSMVLETRIRADAKPAGLRVSIETTTGSLKEDWEPRWDERYNLFTKRLQNRRMKLLPDASTQFRNLYSAGTIARRRQSSRPKNTRNGLISEFVGKTWGLTDRNSTFCHTQNTDKWKSSSREKRLDVNPGQMDAGALSRVYEALNLLTSAYGKSLLGSCNLLAKEEVESMINRQGSTGALDDGHTLSDFMLRNPNWYETAVNIVQKWQNGESTDGYFTCRPKSEPKKKKCVDGGKLIVSNEEELEEYGEQGHRFIQFADAQTRLAHYVLLGDVLKKGGRTKLYKGTINGTPPMYMGRVIRALWDMNSVPGSREIEPDSLNATGVAYNILGGEKLGGKGAPTALCLDYSGWDTTVTLGERMIEADFFARFYPPALRPAVMNCFREMSCPITVDDDGNIWFRAGQRGSGELVTSIGNTALVAANTAVSIAACTGLSLEEVCRTAATVKYVVGRKSGEAVYKDIEVTQFCQLSDGDDTFIVTTSEWAQAIVNNIEETLTLQRKKIRSGTSGGAAVCDKFDDIEFCSHNYSKVVIDEKKWWLPTRPVADILSKMRLTLKVNTSRWDIKNQECVEVTRSKILSYLILYPHIRSVRYSCISLLAVTGDGTFKHDEFSRRWEWQTDLSSMTAMQALHSVYGIRSLDEIGLIRFKDEIKHLLVLRQNTRITRNVSYVNLRQYVMTMFYVMLTLGVVDPNIITWDTTYSKLFVSYAISDKLENNAANNIINKQNNLILIRQEMSRDLAWASGHRGFFESVRKILAERSLNN